MENDINELLAALETDIANIKSDIDVLEQMRQCLIKKDEEKMLSLFYKVKAIMQSRHQNDRNRFDIIRKLAEVLSVPVEQMTISKLQSQVAAPYKGLLAEKKKNLSELVDRFKAQYEATKFLLSDCARFNSLLLKGLLSAVSPNSQTYKPGKIETASGPAFVNTQY